LFYFSFFHHVQRWALHWTILHAKVILDSNIAATHILFPENGG